MVKKIEVLNYFHRREDDGLLVDHQVLREYFNLTPCNASNWIRRLLDQQLIKYKSSLNKRFCTYVLTEKGIDKINWKNKKITKNKQLVEKTKKPEKDLIDEICDFLFKE